MENKNNFVTNYVENKQCTQEYALGKYKKAFELLYKYTLGDKRKEILPQLQSILEGYLQGYGIGGIGGWTDFAWDNGTNEHTIKVRLSDIVLWHPVRGEGIERGQAGPKTTQRAESMYQALMSKSVTHSHRKPLTMEQLNRVPNMASDDSIKICPINSSNASNTNTAQVYSAEIESLKTQRLLETTKDPEKRAIDGLVTKKYHDLQDLLYQNGNYQQHFLILSGQGRVQAIIEAVRKANIDPTHFYIKMVCRDVYLDICNVLVRIHNYWVSRGDFNDERHQVYMNGQYVPMGVLKSAFSCAQIRRLLDTQCFTRYTNNLNTSENMGCSDIYNYTDKIPLSRMCTRFGCKHCR